MHMFNIKAAHVSVPGNAGVLSGSNYKTLIKKKKAADG